MSATAEEKILAKGTEYRDLYNIAYVDLMAMVRNFESTYIENPKALLPFLETFVEKANDLIEYIRDNAVVITPSWPMINALYKVIDKTTALVWHTLTRGTPRGEIKINNPTSLYSLCIDLYGDTSRAENIRTHNSIFDILRIKPGTILSVPLLTEV